MKADRIARWMVLLIIVLAPVVLGASSLFASEPTGDSPSNGLSAKCSVESMPSGAVIWYKIPYHKGMALAIDLTAIDGVYFDVFAPDQVKYFPTVGRTMGTSAPNPSDPIYLKSWQGQLLQSDYVLDYYYVRITNTIGIEVKYQLCFGEIPTGVVEPTGDSPMNGLTSEPCTLQFLNSDTQIWHKVPYHSGKEFELYLKTAYANVNFDVFTPEQIRYWPTLGQPIGRGTVNKNEWDYAKSWQGHLLNSDYYYVRVTNSNNVQVQYQLCLIEKELPGPYESPTPILPTPTPRPRFGP